MDEILKQRAFFDMSSAQLRRARRLYMRLIRAEVMLDRSGVKIYQYCRKMRRSGLYSPMQPDKYIACAILKKIYSIDTQAFASHGIASYDQWLRRNGWEGYPYQGYWRRGGPRPALKGRRWADF